MTWLEQLNQDADSVYEEIEKGGQLTYTITGLAESTGLSLPRAYGALVVLVRIRKSVKVQGKSASRSSFYQ